jgi:hypothetical protein
LRRISGVASLKTRAAASSNSNVTGSVAIPFALSRHACFAALLNQLQYATSCTSAYTRLAATHRSESSTHVVALRRRSCLGRQCGPPGWRGELYQAHDPTNRLGGGPRQVCCAARYERSSTWSETEGLDLMGSRLAVG